MAVADMIRPVLASCSALLAFAASGVSAASDGIALEVMSFNVRWDGLDEGKNAWVNRRPVAIDMLKEYAPDVVGLQEPSIAQTRDLDEALEDYASFRGEHERDQHITFLYRSDRFQFLDGGSFWLVEKSVLSGGTRRCVWVRLREKKSRRTFCVFNNHFDHRSSESRKRSALSLVRGILNRKYGDPFVVLGDFNESESGRAIRYLKGTATLEDEPAPSPTPGFALVDTFRAKHPGERNAASGHGFSGITEGPRIDFVFVEKKTRILDARIIHYSRNGLYPSDHYPVTASIQLDSGSKTVNPANERSSASSVEN